MKRTTNCPSGQQTMEAKKATAFYASVTSCALLDLADTNSVSKQESRRDLEELENRVANEGLSFLTVTLPSLGKALDKALAVDGGTLDTVGFELNPSCRYPKFLRCYWSRVFDETGQVLPDADPLCVRAIRQIVYLLYKLEIPPTQEQNDTVVAEFVRVDSELPVHFTTCHRVSGDDIMTVTEPYDNAVLLTASNIVAKLFRGFDPRDIKPKHGPGAVATGEKNHEKHCFKRIYQDIEAMYPFMDYFVSGLNHVAHCYPELQRRLKPLKSGTAKVVLVPKDSRGPRLISCEPLEFQWIQQGLGNAIRHHIERRGGLAYRQINFADQTINRNLALAGSLGCGWVTLDMKEASDRVSVALVRSLFAWEADTFDCLMACRSTCTRLPNGDVLALRKFAPMGSNLCFPVESIVFWALAVAAIVHKDPVWSRCKAENMRKSYWRAIGRVAKDVFVYGDDIVCKTEDYQVLLDTLPTFGLLFNVDKCCIGGSFRESCGMDAFKGYPVQPLRLKRLWSVSRKQDALTVASYVAFRNAAYVHGLHRVAELITPLITTEVGPLPVMAWNCSRSPYEFQPLSALALVEHGTREGLRSQQSSARTRFNRKLQRVEVRCLLPTSVDITVDSDDWSMVLGSLLNPGREAPGIFPSAHRVYLKWAWIRAGG